MFSMPIKMNFDRGECCWEEEEEEEEEEELCCGRAGGGRAGSPFKEGSFVGFLLWVSGSVSSEGERERVRGRGRE